MQDSAASFDSTFFRTALGRFATGVTLITARDRAGAPLGMTVSSFNSVSLSPPLVLWSLSLASSSYAAFNDCESYVIAVLAADQLDLAIRFARGTREERFRDLPLTTAPGGTLMLDLPCASWFECRHHARHPAGDHVIMVGEVVNCEHAALPPLVFHAGGFDLTPVPDTIAGASSP